MEYLIIGGEFNYPRNDGNQELQKTLSRKVFKLFPVPNKDGKQYQWKFSSIDPLLKCRKIHLSFKMKDFIYVIGGENENGLMTCCERYDLTQQKWFQSEHHYMQNRNLNSQVSRLQFDFFRGLFAS